MGTTTPTTLIPHWAAWHQTYPFKTLPCAPAVPTTQDTFPVLSARANPLPKALHALLFVKTAHVYNKEPCFVHHPTFGVDRDPRELKKQR